VLQLDNTGWHAPKNLAVPRRTVVNSYSKTLDHPDKTAANRCLEGLLRAPLGVVRFSVLQLDNAGWPSSFGRHSRS
jgi:hypothetical protein